MEFYTSHPTPTTAWRLAVLMGANSRTYKFALAQALLEHARAGRSEVTLAQLAAPYAKALALHSLEMPQAPDASNLRQGDFLKIAAEDAAQTLREGRPTDRLLDAAIRTMPGMVMQKFHNLNGGVQVPTRFYEVHGSGSRRMVALAPSSCRLQSGRKSMRSTVSSTPAGASWKPPSPPASVVA